MIVLMPSRSNRSRNISNSLSVGTPVQSTMAMAGRSTRRPTAGTRGAWAASAAWPPAAPAARNRFRNERITGSSSNTSARVSEYAIPAGDSALYSTNRSSSEKNPSMRVEGDDRFEPGMCQGQAFLLGLEVELGAEIGVVEQGLLEPVSGPARRPRRPRAAASYRDRDMSWGRSAMHSGRVPEHERPGLLPGAKRVRRSRSATPPAKSRS